MTKTIHYKKRKISNSPHKSIKYYKILIDIEISILLHFTLITKESCTYFFIFLSKYTNLSILATLKIWTILVNIKEYIRQVETSS